jgi:hypothetical protein
MSNRNLYFLLLLLTATGAAGWLIDWWLACGAFVGVAVAAWIYYRRFSVIDEIEAEANWYRNYDRYGYGDDGSGEIAPKWPGVWRLLLVIAVLIAVLIATAIGIF